MNKIKTMLLLVGAALAVVAFAVPAAAQAEGPLYYLGESEETIGEEHREAEAVEGGEGGPGWTLTMSNGTTLGPCSFSSKLQIWNAGGAGQDSITGMTFTTPCQTNVIGCEVTAASAAGLPWAGKLAYEGVVPTDNIGTKAKPMTFSYTLGGGCGVIKNTVVTATANGPVPATYEGGGCFKFSKAGSFTLSVKGVTGTLDAVECRNIKGKLVIAK
jgi:hypothetical protein